MSDEEMVRWALVAVTGSALATWATLCAVAALRRFFPRAPKPSASPSHALGVDRGGPYRAIAEAGYRDHADLALQVADEAVRRERARMLAIVRAVGETAEYDGERRIIKAIADGIGGGQ